jgi:t-SNARE complex subunit (syntaxin)
MNPYLLSIRNENETCKLQRHNMQSQTDAMRRDFTSPYDEYVDTPQEEDVEEHEQRRRRPHSDEPPP